MAQVRVKETGTGEFKKVWELGPKERALWWPYPGYHRPVGKVNPREAKYEAAHRKLLEDGVLSMDRQKPSSQTECNGQGNDTN